MGARSTPQPGRMSYRSKCWRSVRVGRGNVSAREKGRGPKPPPLFVITGSNEWLVGLDSHGLEVHLGVAFEPCPEVISFGDCQAIGPPVVPTPIEFREQVRALARGCELAAHPPDRHGAIQ